MTAVTPTESDTSVSESSIPRTKTVVDREIQFGIIRKIAFHWIALFACNCFALMIWVRLFEQPEASWAETGRECIRRFLPFLIVTTCLIPAFVLDTLKLTNRFAGPISRLRQEIAKAASGSTVSPLKFRQNDYWREIADGFNALIDRAGLQASDVSAHHTKQG
ncbi:MAG: hypothetical protein AAF539_01525 [Planctomycetota bacterium]